MRNLYVVIYKYYGEILYCKKTSTKSISELKKDRVTYYELMNNTYKKSFMELLDIVQIAREQDAEAVYNQFLETT